MTANIIAFPSHNRVRLVPVKDDDMDLPLPVRQLLELMEAQMPSLTELGATVD